MTIKTMTKREQFDRCLELRTELERRIKAIDDLRSQCEGALDELPEDPDEFIDCDDVDDVIEEAEDALESDLDE